MRQKCIMKLNGIGNGKLSIFAYHNISLVNVAINTCLRPSMG